MSQVSYEGCDCGGEHRTVGERAWCLDCSEWCYPGEGMQCEIAVLRAENVRLKAELARRDEEPYPIRVSDEDAEGLRAIIAAARGTDLLNERWAKDLDLALTDRPSPRTTFCDACGEVYAPGEEADPCLGILPYAISACCGHGGDIPYFVALGNLAEAHCEDFRARLLRAELDVASLPFSIVASAEDEGEVTTVELIDWNDSSTWPDWMANPDPKNVWVPNGDGTYRCLDGTDRLPPGIADNET